MDSDFAIGDLVTVRFYRAKSLGIILSMDEQIVGNHRFKSLNIFWFRVGGGKPINRTMLFFEGDN